MASFNSTVFLALLVVISALLAAPSSVEAQTTLPRIIINGTVACSVNASIPTNGTNRLPPFANALVQLSCGSRTLATTTTDAFGVFRFLISAIENVLLILSSLLSGASNNCRLVVTTPLATCNSTLPTSGFLVSNLTQLPVTGLPVISPNNVINVGPRSFQFALAI